jgi:hypothetical protein
MFLLRYAIGYVHTTCQVTWDVYFAQLSSVGEKDVHENEWEALKGHRPNLAPLGW